MDLKVIIKIENLGYITLYNNAIYYTLYKNKKLQFIIPYIRIKNYNLWEPQSNHKTLGKNIRFFPNKTLKQQ